MKRIRQSLQQQIDLNKTKNILYAQLDQIVEIDPDFLAVLEELLNSGQEPLSKSALHEAVSSASRMLLERLYAINQFLQIDEPQLQQLENIYLRTWRRIVETRDIQATLQDYHYPELSKWIAQSYPRKFLKPLAAAPAISHVVCAEYTPQLQMDLLRIDRWSLKRPLLDLGCGSTAGLVRHLRKLGIEAYGVDRQIEKTSKYLQEIDWFDCRFEPETWGTITSNMAFTNHLLYTSHHDRVQLKRYLRTFKAILESLTIGGSFHYAPSVPFVEQQFDRNAYRVDRFNVVKAISMTKITRIAQSDNNH